MSRPVTSSEVTMSRTSTFLQHFELAEAVCGADVTSIDSAAWLPAVVPGGVHESLLAAGRIEDPYRDENESSIRWIEERDWWFRGRFSAPADLQADERVRLVFHGLDTVAEVWLNGERIGRHANMFRPAEFEVTSLLAPTNEVLVRFSPPLDGLEVPPSVADVMGRMGAILGDLAEGTEEGPGIFSPSLARATLRRKATFSWGWDFGPRVPSVGIWRPVELRRERVATITGHHVRTDALHEDGSADVTVSVEVDAFAGGTLAARARLGTPGGESYELEFPLAGGSGSGFVTVPDARLWWTHDLGEPALHDVSISLTADGVEVDRVVDRVGLRTVTLDRSPDPEGGHRFGFVLNGVPVFARGAAWLPASMLVGSVTAERHRELVELARDGGMTMLRIWGGGVYEQDSFYAACDELGVMVWHDFMFACIDYPSEDQELAAEVAAEAAYQVRRLRNRACMALWAGNNEVQLVHGFAYQNYDPGDWGWGFFHDLLPRTVAELDGCVPYWPGSPWGDAPEEGFMAVNGVLSGDRHAWEVWHGMDFGAGGGDFASVGEARHYRRYAQDRGKFISEFGIHASPEKGTLERWIDPTRLSVHSRTFDWHNKDNPKDKADPILEIITGLPTSLDEYVDFTMVAQAEGLKFGIEHYRRRQPSNNGTLIWQFNDVWPGFTWSVVDYDLVPKAAYYYAKRAFAPVLASFRRDGDRLELWVSNSTARPVDVRALVTLGSVDDTLGEHVEVRASVQPRGSVMAWHTRGELTGDQVAWVESPDGIFPANRLFFAEIKDIPFIPAALEVNLIETGAGRVTIDVVADRYAYFVHVPTPVPGLRFSDNYLDLRPGEPRRIEVRGLTGAVDASSLVVLPYAGI
ncbi:MAG TPA: glycoside hydrolase family 2 protein [Propionibacteriaceae bacterium]|nr:glycoside hydrolase family 2 protein [Propionibacteriaceae bacterium]